LCFGRPANLVQGPTICIRSVATRRTTRALLMTSLHGLESIAPVIRHRAFGSSGEDWVSPHALGSGEPVFGPDAVIIGKIAVVSEDRRESCSLRRGVPSSVRNDLDLAGSGLSSPYSPASTRARRRLAERCRTPESKVAPSMVRMEVPMAIQHREGHIRWIEEKLIRGHIKGDPPIVFTGGQARRSRRPRGRRFAVARDLPSSFATRG